MIRLIINGKWKTPNHNQDKTKDDFHRSVKKEILKRVGRKIYQKHVGKNPNIEIDKKTNKIVLKSQKEKNKIFPTDIPAEDHFILNFYFDPLNINNIFSILSEDDCDLNCVNEYVSSCDLLYIIPPNEKLLEGLLDYLITNYKNQELKIVLHII